MKSLWAVLAAPVVASMGIVGCGSSGASAPNANTGDAGVMGDDDGGVADAQSTGDSATEGGPSGYPAFVPDIGQITNQHGPVLSSAKIVTITWSTDTAGPMLQTFGDEIGSSTFWATTTSEYGVGPATSGEANHVVVTTPAPSPWYDADIETWVSTQIAGAPGNGWPVPDAQTMYILYTPEATQVTTDDGNGGKTDACSSYEGYHDEIMVGSNTQVVFGIIVGECYMDAPPPVSLVNSDTESAAHEMIEAATDPYFYEAATTGWATFDAPHWAWEVFNAYQDEVADACENNDGVYYLEGADLPFYVQRTWSNASALAGHDPCVPLQSGAYFSATPLGMQTYPMQDGFAVVDGFTESNTPPTVNAKGYKIPVGQTQTFQIGLYSDAPTGDWTLAAVEGDDYQPLTTSLTISLDKTSGNNGDMVNVTVKVNSAPSIGGTAVLMTVVSTQGQASNYLPILIATE